MSLYKVIRPFLFLLPPETAHQFALSSLQFFSHFMPSQPIQNKPIDIAGLHFPNRVGIAAGLDKNGDYLGALFSLGCGFVEVGAVTPKPQAGNPKPRLFRYKKEEALVNRMGFNNKGVDYLVERLKKRKSKGIVGVNLGKNKVTPLEAAYEDYSFCYDRVVDYADFVTINVSSPNTPGLRELQRSDYLLQILKHLSGKAKKIPVFVKLSPDLKEHELLEVVDVLLSAKVDGVIATNTSTALSHREGGLSGAPLFDRSERVVSALAKRFQGVVPIIAAGGINSPERAQAMINVGASLVQVYTGLIYEGPELIRRIAKAL